jgi:hypothetical protein
MAIGGGAGGGAIAAGGGAVCWAQAVERQDSAEHIQVFHRQSPWLDVEF